MTTNTTASVLSLLLPCLLYTQAIIRVFHAGRRKRLALTAMPAMSFAFASLWLASSLKAQWNGGLGPDAAWAQLTFGPALFGFLVLVVELPFFAYWLADRLGKRSVAVTAK